MTSVKDPFLRVTFQENQPISDMLADVRKATLNKIPDSRIIEVEAPAIEIDSSQLYMQGRLDSAVDDGIGGSNVSLELTNLPNEVADRIKINGFMTIEGGYEGTFGDTQIEETIFTGQITWKLPFRRGAESGWRITASTNTTRITNIPIYRNFPGEHTIGEIMEDIAQTVGASISVHRSAFGEGGRTSEQQVTITDYTAYRTLQEELDILTNMLINRNRRVYKLIPAWQQRPFSYNLVSYDLTKEVEKRIEDPSIKTAEVEVRAFEYDLEEDIIYSASLSPTRKARDIRTQQTETEIVTVEDWINHIIDQEKADIKLEYRVSIPFDPRMNIGEWVKIIDEDGSVIKMNLNSVAHNFGGQDWRTTFAGEVLESDIVG